VIPLKSKVAWNYDFIFTLVIHSFNILHPDQDAFFLLVDAPNSPRRRGLAINHIRFSLQGLAKKFQMTAFLSSQNSYFVFRNGLRKFYQGHSFNSPWSQCFGSSLCLWSLLDSSAHRVGSTSHSKFFPLSFALLLPVALTDS
jgi:hypothetical protein